MKTNIKEIAFPELKKEQIGSGYFSWDEFCDRCKIKIASFGNHGTNRRPKESSTDLCYECLIYCLENEIDYYKGDN